MDVDSWTSDEDPTVATKHFLPERPNRFQSKFCTLQQKKTLSVKAKGSKGKRRTILSSHRGSSKWTKADKYWVALLERYNEALISQINTLTSDLCTTERHLRRNLQRAERQIIHLKSHISNQERTHRVSETAHICQLDTLQTRLSQEAIINSRKYTIMKDYSEGLENEIRGLLHDRVLLKQMADRREDEVLRVKQRNAKLAERIVSQGDQILLRTPSQQYERACTKHFDIGNPIYAHGAQMSLGLPSPLTPTMLSLADSTETGLEQPRHHLFSRTIDLEKQYQTDIRSLESRDKDQLLCPSNTKIIKASLSPSPLYPSGTQRASAQHDDEGLVAAHPDRTLFAITKHTTWPVPKIPVKLLTATEKDDRQAAPSRDLATQQWFHRLIFNPGKAQSRPVEAAVRAMQWACFVICLVLAAGLTLREGPRLAKKVSRCRFANAVVRDYDSDDKNDDDDDSEIDDSCLGK